MYEALRSKKIDKRVVNYLMHKLKHLYIEVLDEYEGSLFELMKVGKLEGWCWETTESAIVFLNDDDFIERGILKFDERTPQYYHSWICFKFDGTEYVLDPCLNFLCQKSDYSKIFEIDVKAKVSAKAVKEEFIRQITTPKANNAELDKIFYSLMKNLMGNSYDSYIESKKEEITVSGTEDINAPLYRNGAGYKPEIDNGKIKKLIAHYYF